MIYVAKSDLVKPLLIPRSASNLPSGDYRLVLRSNVGRDAVSIAVAVVDSKLFHDIDLSWPDAQVGEYTYTLYKGIDVVASGLLIVTEERESAKEFNYELEYEQKIL